jgi:hypothetical protein
MKVITVRQPWAHAIIHGGKDVENRSWGTLHRGPVAIHAGMAVDSSPKALQVPSPPMTLIPRGAIIGVVDLVDVVTDSTSKWVDLEAGEFQWVLENPRSIEPITHTGALGLRTLPEDVEMSILFALLGGKAASERL